MWPFTKRKTVNDHDGFLERRSSGGGYTAEIMAAREAWFSGRRGIAELTATAQTCISLWEAGIGMADVEGTDLLDRHTLAMMGRSLALRGEALFYAAPDRLVPAYEWDVATRMGQPRGYRLSIADTGGGRTIDALAGEVLHVRLGCDPAAPWAGVAPLRRAQLTSGLLEEVETALAEVYRYAPLGSSIVPFPEAPDTDLAAFGRSFHRQRGRVAVRESVNVAAAGGPMPVTDWRANSISPDIEKAMPLAALSAARDAVALAYGVLPAFANPAVTGPAVREAQRHLATWMLQPVAVLIAEAASRTLDTTVTLDLMRPLQAYDVGGRARAVTAIVGALAQAKESGVDPALAMKIADLEGIQ